MAEQSFGIIILWLIIAVIIIVVAVYILRWLYRRSTKDIAFVRTGFGGEKVVINGGAFVIPVLHEITPVNMNILRIEVIKRETQALITKNFMRVDVAGEFFVRVAPTPKAVSAVAQTISNLTLNPDGMRELLQGKFAAALRDVAANTTMESLHENRREYALSVKSLVNEELLNNGLELESVAIVNLDQTNLEFFDPSNSFDAVGLTQLTETVESRRKMRNEIEQRTLVDIRSQNLVTQKQVFDIDRENEYARLEQEREIEMRRLLQRTHLAKEQAVRDQESEQAKLLARENVEISQIKQERSLADARIQNEEETQRREILRRRALDESELKSREQTEQEQIALEGTLEKARIQNDRNLEQERLAKERELRRLTIENEKAIEVSEIQKSIEISKKSAECSTAVAASEAARAHAIQAEEQVFTAREREIAERKKIIDIINTQRETESESLRLISKAEAEKNAALLIAKAMTVTAEAEAETEKIKVIAAEKRYTVDAEGQKQIAEAENTLNDSARQSRYRHKLLDKIEGIVRESVRPMEKIEGIKILHVDGISGGKGDNRNVTDEVIDSALRYRVQAPMIDNLLKDIGIESGSVGRMTEVLRDAKDLSKLAKEKEKEKNESVIAETTTDKNKKR